MTSNVTPIGKPQVAYNIYRGKTFIDTVFYNNNIPVADVTYDLVQEYGDDITVTWKGQPTTCKN